MLISCCMCASIRRGVRLRCPGDELTMPGASCAFRACLSSSTVCKLGELSAPPASIACNRSSLTPAAGRLLPHGAVTSWLRACGPRRAVMARSGQDVDEVQRVGWSHRGLMWSHPGGGPTRWRRGRRVRSTACLRRPLCGAQPVVRCPCVEPGRVSGHVRRMLVASRRPHRGERGGAASIRATRRLRNREPEC